MKDAIVLTARSEDEEAINVVVEAFSADPVARWIYPEAKEYRENFPRLVKAFAGAAFAHGSAHHVEDFFGAALWLPPGAHADDEALSTLLQETVAESRQAEVLALFEQMDKHHPVEPHWYLPLIGVHPVRQGRGYGSALLNHALARFDREGALAYLEASSLLSIPLYQRHGFEPIGTIQVGSSPPLFPMVRKPRSVSESLALLADRHGSRA